MEDLIKQLGSKFRGVWCAKPITKQGDIRPVDWFCTFEFRNDIQETRPCASPKDALRIAIGILKFE